MNRDVAARKIQTIYRRKKPVRLSRNVKNAFTLNNLGPRVVEAWNAPGAERYYMNPSTYFRLLTNNGVYISPRSRNPASFAFRNAVYYGRSSRKMLTQKNRAAARRVSRNLAKTMAAKRKRGQNFIPNNANGYVSENWNWQPPSPQNTRVTGGNQFTRYLAAGSPANNRTPGRVRTPRSGPSATPRSLRMTPGPRGGTRRRHTAMRNGNRHVNNFASP